MAARSDLDIPRRANITELQTVIGTSDNSIRKHIRKAELKPDKHGRYKTQDVMEAVVKGRAQDGRLQQDQGGSIGRVKQIKGALECQILQVKLDILKGKFVSMEEVEKTVDEVVGMLTGALEQWIQMVGNRKRDPELLEWARDICDDARRGLISKRKQEGNEAGTP